MEAFDFYHEKYTLACRNKCHFKHYFLEICREKRAEILCECYKFIQELFVQILRYYMEKCVRACSILAAHLRLIRAARLKL